VKRFVALLIALAAVGFATYANGAPNDWFLLDTKGESFRLSSELTGRPVLLLFWATWCAPCKKEIQDQRNLFASYAKKGVNVLLVSEDTQRTQARVKPYVESKGYAWRTLLDPQGEVLKRYAGTSIPYAVLLDAQGQPVLKLRGALRNTAALTAKVDNLLQAAGNE
jgi:peroxiredoxin